LVVLVPVVSAVCIFFGHRFVVGGLVVSVSV
jgi:hypothetical protein